MSSGFIPPFWQNTNNCLHSAKIAGFTLIEIIITIVVIAIFVSGAALVFHQIIEGSMFSGDLIEGLNLARREMSKVINLAYGDATLDDGYDTTTTNYDSSGYDLNRKVDIVAGTSDNLKKVEVTVYPTGKTNQLVKLATYVADVSFGPGSGGAAPGSGQEADSLTVSGGTISGKKLQNIDMENTDATDDITLSQVTVSWTNSNPANPASLTTIEMDSSTRWSGSEATSGTTIALTSTFTLSAATSYNNTGKFTFSQNVSSVTLTFIMSDASSTSGYSW